MEQKRFSKWVEVSHGLSKIEPFMIPIVQGLGNLDAKLIVEDDRYLKLPKTSRDTIEESMNLTERFTLSYLWVLGTYELVRTLTQRCRETGNLLGENLVQDVIKLKQDIERLRIPLAKMEPSRRHQKSDAPIAYPAIHNEFGISWRVSQSTYIARREISDKFLSLLEQIRQNGLTADCTDDTERFTTKTLNHKGD